MNKPFITLASAAALALAACGETGDDTATVDDQMAMNDQMANSDVMAESTIVEVAQDNPDLATLVSAIRSAELGETLSGDGPYTLFAPTNAAFEKVPQSSRDELMSEAGKGGLTNILTYHVVEGETMEMVLASAIENAGEEGYEIKSSNGATLTATMEGSDIVLRDGAGNTAIITATDIDASNGVIHTIDTVLMPG